MCLAAHSQVDGVACGFVSLSCDVDLDVLSTCFDLEPFQGLCRSLTSDDNAKSEAVVQGGYPRMVVGERTDVWILYTDCCVQWNLSIEDTIGTQLAVLYREVSLTQR